LEKRPIPLPSEGAAFVIFTNRRALPLAGEASYADGGRSPPCTRACAAPRCCASPLRLRAGRGISLCSP